MVSWPNARTGIARTPRDTRPSRLEGARAMNITVNAYSPADFAQLVHATLPAARSVQVRHDAPGALHHWHQIQAHQTLIVLEGGLEMKSPVHEIPDIRCGPGDAVVLQAGTRRISRALGDGAVYLIASRTLELP